MNEWQEKLDDALTSGDEYKSKWEQLKLKQIKDRESV